MAQKVKPVNRKPVNRKELEEKHLQRNVEEVECWIGKINDFVERNWTGSEIELVCSGHIMPVKVIREELADKFRDEGFELNLVPLYPEGPGFKVMVKACPATKNARGF